MNICLLGNNLTNLLLANILLKKKIQIDIICKTTSKNAYNSNRTIAITNENYKFLGKNIKGFNAIGWPSEKIRIYSKKSKSTELFEFKNQNHNNFYLLKYDEIKNLLEKNIKSNKFIKFINKIKYNYNNIINKNYNLIINSEQNNPITKKFFQGKVEKNYNSISYTTIIDHKKIHNKTAIQVFTKNGPLAFLPLSNFQTSVVFSKNSTKKINQRDFREIIEKFNLKYKINNISDIESFNIKFSFLRNYTFKNILSFGDLIHKIHPLAGQGFNMTIRDVKILSQIIDENIQLGIDDGVLIAQNFEKKTKHFNFIYGTGIDFINTFFELDNKFSNKLSNYIFKILKTNNYLNRYATYFSNKGIL